MHKQIGRRVGWWLFKGVGLALVIMALLAFKVIAPAAVLPVVTLAFTIGVFMGCRAAQRDNERQAAREQDSPEE